MRLVCGVSSIEGLERAAALGAEEVFLGIQDRREKSAFFRILNRREHTHANLDGLPALDALLRRAKSLGKRVFITLNETFTRPQYDVVRTFLGDLCSRPIDGLIVSDLGLLLLLENEFPGRFVIHMGCGAVSLNQGTVKLYLDHGAGRIILSRKLFTHEILSLVRAFPDTEFEAFMEATAYCPNLDGLCNLLHNNNICSAGSCAVIERGYTEMRKREVMNIGCKLCALWDYARVGIKHLKIPYRERRLSETAPLFQLVNYLNRVVWSLSKAEFVALAKRSYERTFRKPCPNPKGCVLAREFDH
jgi:collagenase-like PrtC family protease